MLSTFSPLLEEQKKRVTDRGNSHKTEYIYGGLIESCDLDLMKMSITSILSFETQKLAHLYKLLSGKGKEALKIYGEVKSVLDGKVDRIFVVDKWPHFSALISKPGPENKLEFINNVYTFFADDKSRFKNLLEQDGVMEWNKRLSLSAIPEPLLPVLQSVITAKGGTVSTSTMCHTFILNPCRYKEPIVPPNVYVSKLKPTEASLVTEAWEYSDDSTLQFMQWMIENFETVCIRDAQSHDPLGFSLQQWFGAVGMGYVKPEHRGTGVGKLLSLLSKRLCDNDTIAYSHTEVNNKVSIGVQKSIGYELADCPLVCWVTYTPPARIRSRL